MASPMTRNQISMHCEIAFTSFVILELFEDASKDVDFRVGLMPTSSQPAAIADAKKRLSEESDSTGPKSKKTKSEKIDM